MRLVLHWPDNQNTARLSGQLSGQGRINFSKSFEKLIRLGTKHGLSRSDQTGRVLTDRVLIFVKNDPQRVSVRGAVREQQCERGSVRGAVREQQCERGSARGAVREQQCERGSVRGAV